MDLPSLNGDDREVYPRAHSQQGAVSPRTRRLPPMPNFHSYRYRPRTYKNPVERLWHFHDRHPPPRPYQQGGAGGSLLTAADSASSRSRSRRTVGTTNGDPVVPRQDYLEPRPAL